MLKCDRCGKKMEYPYDRVNVTVHISYPNALQNGNVIWLCPDCQEELKTWIEKGNENGKA